MTGNDLFNPGEPDPAPIEEPIDPAADPYEALVGEGKKFKTPTDLAKSKVEADRFITQLQKETKELRDELQKRLSVEDFVAQIKPPAPDPSASTPPNQGVDERENTNPANMSPEQITQLVQDNIKKQREVDTQTNNVELVKRELKKKWGSNYAQHLEGKTQELGFGRDFATGMAATHPQAFLNLMLDRPVNAQADVAPPNSSVRSSPSSPGEKNYAFYQKMRRDNPKEYNSQRVQLEMYKQAEKLGTDFYS